MRVAEWKRTFAEGIVLSSLQIPDVCIIFFHPLLLISWGCSSVGPEHLSVEQDVAGSNPVILAFIV